MWLLDFLPTILIHLAFVLSLLVLVLVSFMSFVLGVVPSLTKYASLIVLVSALILGTSLYFEGALAYKQSQAIAVAKLETSLANAQALANSANTKLEAALGKKTQIIYQKGAVVNSYLDKNKEKIDSQCVVAPEVIDSLNAAATQDTSKIEPTAVPIVEPKEEPKKNKFLFFLPPRTDK